MAFIPLPTSVPRGEERKKCRLAEEETRESTARAFQAYDRPLKLTTSSKYLGRKMMALDDDWTVVVGNLRKARKIWARLSRILGRDGVNQRVSGMFFKEMVQPVLIFGLEKWVMKPHMVHALGGVST